jgi:hypothetical protein
MLSNVMGSVARGAGVGALWEVVITEWALDAYLNLKHSQVFSDQEYWQVLRPDVELLRDGLPSPHAKFAGHKFWGPATFANNILPAGHKMKWHQIGPGAVQLRLPVNPGPGPGGPSAFLCKAYVKTSVASEQREMARFKTHMNLIVRGRYVYRGSI